MFLECGDRTFSHVDLVVVRRDKLNVILLDLMNAFTIFEHPLPVMFRVGL